MNLDFDPSLTSVLVVYSIWPDVGQQLTCVICVNKILVWPLRLQLRLRCAEYETGQTSTLIKRKIAHLVHKPE